MALKKDDSARLNAFAKIQRLRIVAVIDWPASLPDEEKRERIWESLCPRMLPDGQPGTSKPTNEAADELDVELPKTWEGKMEAMVAGTVKYDDWDDVAYACAIAADSRLAMRKGPDQIWLEPLWWEVMPWLLEELHRFQTATVPDMSSKLSRLLIRCGHAADLADRTVLASE